MTRCKADAVYFIDSYLQVLNATDETWLPFDLWPAQRDVLRELNAERQVVILKARQLGLTWVCLAYALWRMIFHPIATIGIFSRTETDASELLDNRLKRMYERLPAWMRTATVLQDNKAFWQLSTGSTARAFATNGGRQYTFSIVMVDEADFQPDLAALMEAVKPTIDAGGRMWLISSSNKDLPNSRFKNIYREAKRSRIGWRDIFLPWSARPERTPEWYAEQCEEDMRTNGALDTTYQEYPATDTEALAPRMLDKRIPAPWIEACFVEEDGIIDAGAPALPDLVVYRPPAPNRRYVIGADPAEGNPTSDDSALCVMDILSGEEVAELSGKLQPSTLAAYADVLGRWYNDAGLMAERNNHGHAVLQWWEEHSKLRRLPGHDDKPGWLSNHLGKTLLYNELADSFRDETTTLHSFATYVQIASIEGSTLLAPEGQHDDRADAYALAHVGRAAAMVEATAMRQATVKGRASKPMIRSSRARRAA